MSAADSSQTHLVQKLFLNHTSRLYGFIYSLYPDPSEAEDLLHEVFLTLTKKADSFEPGSDFLAWARAVARRKVMEALRRRRRAPGALSEDVVERLVSASNPFFDKWEEKRMALSSCLQKLTEKVRRMLQQRYAGDRGYADIAARLGWSPAAVQVALSRARTSLRQCIRHRLKP